jgi:hypothetical protein
MVMHTSVLRKSFVDLTGPGLHVIEYDTSETIDDDFAVGIFYQAYLEERAPDYDEIERAMALFSRDMMSNETLFSEIKKVKRMK